MAPNQLSMPNPCNPAITCVGALRQNSAFRPMASNCVVKSPDRENATSLLLNIFGERVALWEYKVLRQPPSKRVRLRPLQHLMIPNLHPHLLKAVKRAERAESRHRKVATTQARPIMHPRLHIHIPIHCCPGNPEGMNGTPAYQKPVTRSALMVQPMKK